MKKLLLLLTLVANGFACNCYAQTPPSPEENPENIFISGAHGQIGDPKSMNIEVSAYLNQGVVTVSIDWYAGYADIYVEDEDGNEVADDTIYVNGHASTQLNVSTLSSGTYTLYIKLRDGSIFSGSFQI